MKRIILIVGSLLCTLAATAQYREPRPDWFITIPVAPFGDGFVYVAGVGKAKTEEEAYKKARYAALYEAFSRAGAISFSSQEGKIDELSRIASLNAVVSSNTLPQRLVCRTLPIWEKNSYEPSCKVYVLMQVQANTNNEAKFAEFKDCESERFTKEMEEWKAWRGGKRVVSSDESVGSRLFTGKSNILWGIIGYTHPHTISTKLSNRWGGTFGIGFNGTVGLSVNSVSKEDLKTYSFQNEEEDDIDASLYWSAGIRLYVYNGLFVSAGYGCSPITYYIQELFADKSPSPFIVWNRSYAQQYSVGYELLTADAFALSLEGGVTRENDKYKLMFSVHIGIGFEI